MTVGLSSDEIDDKRITVGCDEIVDYVDENDQILGQKFKRECHAKNILHRGSAILVWKTEDRKELLIQVRSSKHMTNPGKKCFPGGHLKAGESYLEGGLREYSEEMYEGSMDKKLAFRELFKIKKDADNDFEYVTLFETVDEGPFCIEEDEVESYFFIELEKLHDQVLKNPEEFNGSTVLYVVEYILTRI